MVQIYIEKLLTISKLEHITNIWQRFKATGMVANKKALSTWYPETLVFKMPICHVLKRLLGAGCLLGCRHAAWLHQLTPSGMKSNNTKLHCRNVRVQFVTEILCFFFVFLFFSIGGFGWVWWFMLCTDMPSKEWHGHDYWLRSCGRGGRTWSHDSYNSLTFQDQEMWIHCIS